MGVLDGSSYVSQRCVRSKMAAVPSASSLSLSLSLLQPLLAVSSTVVAALRAAQPFRLLYFLPLFLSPFFIIAFYLMGSARRILMHRLISIQQHRRFFYSCVNECHLVAAWHHCARLELSKPYTILEDNCPMNLSFCNSPAALIAIIAVNCLTEV